MKFKLTVIMLACITANLPTYTHAGSTPASVGVYLAIDHLLPRSNFNLDYCAIASYAVDNNITTPFDLHTWAWLEEITLPVDYTHRLRCKKNNLPIILAYDGWCTAGVEDATSGDGPHFTQSILPVATVVTYDDSIVVYINHCTKRNTPRTDNGELVAESFLLDVAVGKIKDIDIRGMSLPIYPPHITTCVPTPKGTP